MEPSLFFETVVEFFGQHNNSSNSTSDALFIFEVISFTSRSMGLVTYSTIFSIALLLTILLMIYHVHIQKKSRKFCHAVWVQSLLSLPYSIVSIISFLIVQILYWSVVENQGTAESFKLAVKAIELTANSFRVLFYIISFLFGVSSFVTYILWTVVVVVRQKERRIPIDWKWFSLILVNIGLVLFFSCIHFAMLGYIVLYRIILYLQTNSFAFVYSTAYFIFEIIENWYGFTMKPFIHVMYLICGILMNYYEDLVNKKAEEDEHRLILFDKIEGSDPHRAKLKINRQLFEINFDSIELLDHIATGGSGAFVYRAKLNQNDIVAVKIFQTKFLNDQQRFSEFEHELTLMSSVRHKNIISFYGASLDPPRVAIITEFCDNGSLANYISSHKDDFSWELKLQILYDIVKALHYLHSRNVIHRDVKSDNILLDSKLTAKVTDFGLSKVIADLTKSHMTFHVGTSIYIAPEVVKGISYDSKCDIYSLSIIMYEMYYETNNPYGNDIKGSIEYQVASNAEFRPKIELSLEESEQEWYIELMQKCWSDDPQRRPTAAEIIQIMEQHTPSLARSNSLYGKGSHHSSQEQSTDQQQQQEPKKKKKPNKFASTIESSTAEGFAQDLKG